MSDWEVLIGDCRDVMALTMADNSVDAIITDPPYELGFMGKAWDASGIAYDQDVWREALRILKPGGQMLAFSGSRTYHRMVVAIEDAGFEIRDQLMWLYGSGFPKSKNLDGDWQGWGTALKPAHEPIVLARKPLIGTVAGNVLAHGTGALNIDGCRVEASAADVAAAAVPERSNLKMFVGDGEGRAETRFDMSKGRWPANIMLDGSDEVLAGFPETKSGALNAGHKRGSGVPSWDGGGGVIAKDYGGDSGSAARFFYCPKASRKDRNDGGDNAHPTVKPTELMRYLCRLITPPGGLVFDPFTGSGSTGRGAVLEGFDFVGAELSKDYAAIARARIAKAAS